MVGRCIFRLEINYLFNATISFFESKNIDAIQQIRDN